MRILSLDTQWPYIERLAFDEPAAASQLDTAGILVWRPAATLARYARHTERLDEAGRPVLTPAASQQLLADARRWRAAFETLIAQDGLLVVLLDELAALGVHTLQEVVAFEVQEILPGAPLSLRTLAQAGPPAWRCGAPFRRPLEQLGRGSQAHTAIGGSPGTALAHAAGSDAVVALYRYQQPGHLLLLPTPGFAGDEANAADARALLVELAGALTGRPEIAVTPAEGSMLYDAEQQALTTIAAHRAQQRELDRQVRMQQRLLHRCALARTVASGRPADAARAWELLLPGLGARTDGEETAPACSVGFFVGDRVCLLQFAEGPDAAVGSPSDLANLRALAASRYGETIAAKAWIRLAIHAEADPHPAVTAKAQPDSWLPRASLAGLVFDPEPQRALIELCDPVLGPARADALARLFSLQSAR